MGDRDCFAISFSTVAHALCFELDPVFEQVRPDERQDRGLGRVADGCARHILGLVGMKLFPFSFFPYLPVTAGFEFLAGECCWDLLVDDGLMDSFFINRGPITLIAP